VDLRRVAAVAVTSVIAAAAAAVGQPAFAADRFRDSQWHLKALKVAEANKISTGTGVVVAVVDSGVYPHIDLRKNLLSGTSVTSGGNGKNDHDGHGTEMASLIAAHGRPNGSGVVGIAPAAKILPVVDTNADGTGDSFKTAKGVTWAIEHGARVINYSGATGPSFDLNEAIALAAKKDVLVVAAAGNKSQDVVAAYPAAIPGVLSVGASDESGRPAPFTVTSKSVQLCAPGVNIESASPNNRYWNGQGTSESTAIVSGAAALIRAKFPDLSASDVIRRLTTTATDNGVPGRDDRCGYGVINIVKALTAGITPGQSSAGASQSAAASSATSASGNEDAAPTPTPAADKTPLVVVAVVVVLLVGGLVAFFVGRRRKTP
jgi:type VII secretion-associated serine protease mycosin